MLIFDASTGIVTGKLKNTTMNKIHASARAFTIGPRMDPSGKVVGFKCFLRPNSVRLMGKEYDMFARRTLQPTRALKAVLLPTYMHPRTAMTAQQRMAISRALLELGGFGRDWEDGVSSVRGTL